MRKIWDKIVAWFLGIPVDKRLHFVAGFILSTFCAVALGFRPCIITATVAGFVKEFFDRWTGHDIDWMDFAATCIGGALVQVFVLLNMWWF